MLTKEVSKINCMNLLAKTLLVKKAINIILLPVSTSLGFSPCVIIASKEKKCVGKTIITFENSPSGLSVFWRGSHSIFSHIRSGDYCCFRHLSSPFFYIARVSLQSSKEFHLPSVFREFSF